LNRSDEDPAEPGLPAGPEMNDDQLEEELERSSDDPGKLSRLAAGIPVVPAFDGYRTFAVLGIVILHTIQNAGVLWGPEEGGIQKLLWAGDLGESCLDMLFVTSGFVLFLPAAVRNGYFGSAKSFFVVRAARLFPAYWGVLVLMLLLIAFVDVDPPIPFPSAGDIFLTFTTLEVPLEFWNNTYFLGFGINRAIWTLSLEVTFYLILPLIALRFFKRPLIGVTVAAAIAVLWRMVFNHLQTVSGWFGFHPSAEKIFDFELISEIQFPFWILSFAMGMYGAIVFARLHHRREDADVRKWAVIAQFASLAFLACAILYTAFSEPRFPRHSPAIALSYTVGLAVFMVSTTLTPFRFQALFSNRYSRSLADSSYGIYLVHMVVIAYVARLLTPPTDGTLHAALVWLAIVVPISVATGYLSAEYFERPIRRRAHRYAESRREAKAAAAQVKT